MKEHSVIFVFIENNIGMTQERYKVNSQKSLINWIGRKFTGFHTGTIKLLDGEVEIENGIVVGGNFNIDTTSIIVTDIIDLETNKQLKAHLAHDDFFAVDKFPRANFIITGSAKTKDGRFKIDGLLTIRGITQALSFGATIDIEENLLSVTAEIVVDRTKYGIRYGSGNFFKGLGDKLIYNDFALNLSLVAEA